MTAAVVIRTDLRSAAELRWLARRERDRRAGRRMLAIAGALEERSRAEAARLAGLRDRAKPGRPPTLADAEQALLRAVILRGAEPERDGCHEWTLPALCRWIEARFDKRLRHVFVFPGACATGASSGPTSMAPCGLPPAKALLSCCLKCRPRR